MEDATNEEYATTSPPYLNRGNTAVNEALLRYPARYGPDVVKGIPRLTVYTGKCLTYMGFGHFTPEGANRPYKSYAII